MRLETPAEARRELYSKRLRFGDIVTDVVSGGYGNNLGWIDREPFNWFSDGEKDSCGVVWFCGLGEREACHRLRSIRGCNLFD